MLFFFILQKHFCAIGFCFFLACCSLFEAWRRGALVFFTACPLRCKLWVQGIGHVLLGLYFVDNLVRIAELFRHFDRKNHIEAQKSFWLGDAVQMCMRRVV